MTNQKPSQRPIAQQCNAARWSTFILFGMGLLLASVAGCSEGQTAGETSVLASTPHPDNEKTSQEDHLQAEKPPIGADPTAKKESASTNENSNGGEKPSTSANENPTENPPPKEDSARATQAPKPPPNPNQPPSNAEAPSNQPEDEKSPFPRRIRMHPFPKDAKWLNTAGPLRLKDLRGKFVLLDFWTYCCINCLHILPELKKLERKYSKELVVIGVHSAKFETEKDDKNIAEAILREEIEHPVMNDAEHVYWRQVGVQSWPTLLLIDPEGYAIWGRPGEVRFQLLDQLMQQGLRYYGKKKLVDKTPLQFDLLAHRQQKTPLRFPGKVLADAAGERLFIADTNHNRIVISTLDGKLIDIIGSGAIGAADGPYAKASFNKPQGMALFGDTLYIADTQNHLLRKADLIKKEVISIAGVGEQATHAWPGIERVKSEKDLPDRWVGKPKVTGLNSPWALWVHKTKLYIAMAGPHQIWSMPLDESEIGPYAGNGREDILDGPLLPKRPYEEGYSAFAQPSGLASDGEWLFVADSEGSSIRAVPFDPEKHVKTIVGTAQLPYGRLFEFGDVDGEGDAVRLQHPLGVVFHDGLIYVADTYNNKIKVVDPKKQSSHTFAGTGKPGDGNRPAQFDEPAGITYAQGNLYVADTNNHLIRKIELKTKKVSTFTVKGLTPPAPTNAIKRPSFAGAVQVKIEPTLVQPTNNTVTLNAQIVLPEGWKINPRAPMAYYLEGENDSGPISRRGWDKRVRLEKPASSFSVKLNTTGEGKDVIKLSLNYFYCQEEGEGLCKVGSVVFTIPLDINDRGKPEPVVVRHTTPR